MEVPETDPAKMLTDSPEGIAYLFRWAKAHNAVLNEAHESIAKKNMPAQIYRDAGIGPAGRSCKPSTFDDVAAAIRNQP
jgi:hypothetical protein